jgi:hypothetical protein
MLAQISRIRFEFYTTGQSPEIRTDLTPKSSASSRFSTLQSTRLASCKSTSTQPKGSSSKSALQFAFHEHSKDSQASWSNSFIDCRFDPQTLKKSSSKSSRIPSPTTYPRIVERSPCPSMPRSSESRTTSSLSAPKKASASLSAPWRKGKMTSPTHSRTTLSVSATTV